jgi:integrase
VFRRWTPTVEYTINVSSRCLFPASRRGRAGWAATPHPSSHQWSDQCGSGIKESPRVAPTFITEEVRVEGDEGVLSKLERLGPFVIPGDKPEQPRHDLKRPWKAITDRAGLTGVRLHDLRHTYASFGASHHWPPAWSCSCRDFAEHRMPSQTGLRRP